MVNNRARNVIAVLHCAANEADSWDTITESTGHHRGLCSRGPAARENSRNRDWAFSPVPHAECLDSAATQHQSSPAECLESQ